MGRLISTGIVSLDGYIADQAGRFDWAEPDAEVHAFVNDQERSVGTYLYGRRTYETMAGWETNPSLADQSALMRDFAALWRAADKIVYSTSLPSVVTRRTRLERDFDRAAVQRLKETAGADLTVSGPGLAAHAFRAGLVDELQLYLVPVVVGGGTSYFPAGTRLGLQLLDERRFGSGVVHVRYQVL